MVELGSSPASDPALFYSNLLALIKRRTFPSIRSLRAPRARVEHLWGYFSALHVIYFKFLAWSGGKKSLTRETLYGRRQGQFLLCLYESAASILSNQAQWKRKECSQSHRVIYFSISDLRFIIAKEHFSLKGLSWASQALHPSQSVPLEMFLFTSDSITHHLLHSSPSPRKKEPHFLKADTWAVICNSM
jgi:hypothetical protein